MATISTPTTALSDAWYAMPVLSGRLIRLEPLTIEHTAGYLAAASGPDDAEEIFRWTKYPPADLDGAREHVLTALAARARGERLPYVQLDAATGEVAGTTSYYDVDPSARTLAIGHTWLGKRWWRTGHNTESKLVLLRHAFDTLGAVRVVWHTDIYNTRSQAAIERLGAVREGVLRKHRIRPDGSWRDTVQYAMTDDDWPATRQRLQARLETGWQGRLETGWQGPASDRPGTLER
jgi:RimJ/RimL family protein N-acetyltransferase